MPALFYQAVSDSGVDWDTDSPAASLTLSSNSDRKLLIFVTRERDNPERFVTSIDVSGSPATKLVRADTGAATTEFREDVDLWYYDVGAGESGSKTVTPSLTGASNNDWSLHVIELYNAATGAPTLYHANQSTGAGSLSFSLASCPANSIVVACAVANAGVPSTGIYMTGGVYTELAEEVTVPGHSAAGLMSQCIYKELSTGGTETPSFTKTADTTQDMAGVAVCVEEYVAGGSTVAVGLASESNAALAITTAKQVALGVATAGNTAGAITAVKSSPVGVAQASDTALPIATDLAANLGLAQESNTAFMVDVAKLSSLGFAVEADTALAVAASKQSPLGLAQSSDAALDITTLRVAALGVAGESDAALPITVDGSQVVPLGVALAADTALATNTTKNIALGVATEAATAFSITATRVFALGVAIESDAALALSTAKQVAVGLALESNVGLALLVGGGLTYRTCMAITGSHGKITLAGVMAPININ